MSQDPIDEEYDDYDEDDLEALVADADPHVASPESDRTPDDDQPSG